jgi:ribulose-phosphate 3-epimerase
MIVEPEKYLDDFKKAGAAILSVHVEVQPHLDRTLHAIRERGMRAGVAINPSTPVSLLADVLYCTDVVCLMSVNPGFGGQAFIENTYRKVAELKHMIRNQGTQTLIEIDGGVSDKNAQRLLDLGADVLVAGNYVFKAADPLAAIAGLKGLRVGEKIA